VEGQAGVGPVTIGGNLIDTTLESTAGPIGAVKIGGWVSETSITSEGNITSVSIAGDVENAVILAGATGTPGPISIGAIKVGGNWVASSVSAGIKEGSSDDGFGNANDVLIATSSSIKSIDIAGEVVGSSEASTHYGFDAQSIGSFKVAGSAITLTAAPDLVPLSPETGNVDIALI
jgi:hypothetical protein